MSSRLAIAAIATAATTLIGAQAASAAPSHAPVRVIWDCIHASYEPHQVVIACGDDGIFFKKLRYSSWTATRATGKGQLWVNTDKPNAAAGHFVHYAVTFTMDKPEHVAGQLRYSRIVAHVTNKHGEHETQDYFPPTRRA